MVSPQEISTRRLWTWTALNLSVWPLGFFVATLAGIGQDPAGAGMYGGMAFIAVIVLLGVPISMRLVRLLRADRESIGRVGQVVAILSIVLILLVTLPMLALLFLERYWLPALAAVVVLYFGFFGLGPLRRRR